MAGYTLAIFVYNSKKMIELRMSYIDTGKDY